MQDLSPCFVQKMNLLGCVIPLFINGLIVSDSIEKCLSPLGIDLRGSAFVTSPQGNCKTVASDL